MCSPKSRRENYQASSFLYPETCGAGNISQNHTASIARSALVRAVSEINTVNKVRRREIEKLSCLIDELQYLQPVNIAELSTALGQSLNTTRSQLRKLNKLDLVTKTSFEQHSLYCLNGIFNVFIRQVLEFINYN